MSEENLIKKLHNKDETAFAYIMDKYSKLLWYAADGILHNVCSIEDVEECISDVFFKLWQNPQAFEPARGNLKNYLVLMAKSRALDIYRQKSRYPVTTIDESVEDINADITKSIIRNETLRELDSALDSLEPVDKEIITRRYIDNEKPSEICRKIDMPLRSIENRIYRTKQKLRKLLGGTSDAKKRFY